ncbi:MAG: TraB/GumN family protein [Rhizobiaceae bacterium]|nr:TraB/GumN family protein [Rhizobiaceae bacterium]
MQRPSARADRLAPLALKLVVAANLIFFLTFAAFLAVATTRAHGETLQACTGEDLLATLSAEDPARVAEIATEAAATVNGKGLLWTIEKDGKTSWLFGTMHMTDPRVTELTPAAKTAFDAAGTVVIETTEILDQSKMMEAMYREPELMMFTDDTTLMSLLSEGDRTIVEDGLAQRGISLAAVNKMKPWMLSAMVALPACEMARKAAGAPVLDVKLAEDAKAAGKALAGLETVADQLRAMASLPMEFHIEGLVETIKLGDRMDDVIETMIVLYEREETGMFLPLFRSVMPSGSGDESGYAAFEEAMVKARNRTMADGAAPLLAGGGAFIAVGALHLPGPDGLVEQFRRAGYTVTAAD